MNEFAFGGFDEARENWSKLPHSFIDNMSTIETLGEMKVVLYILRHTWGYGDASKRISTDEFSNGRKDKNGDRIDGGTGLSEPTIREGLKKAIEHGFVVLEIDDSDPARVKKFYGLRGKDDGAQGERVLQGGGKKFTPGGKETYTQGERNLPPYIERNNRKKQEKETTPIPPEVVVVVPALQEEETASTNKAVGAVFELWQNNMPGSLTPLIVDQLKEAIDTYGAIEVDGAIRIAVSAGHRNMRYMQGVLEKRATGQDNRGSNDRSMKTSGAYLGENKNSYNHIPSGGKIVQPDQNIVWRGRDG